MDRHVKIFVIYTWKDLEYKDQLLPHLESINGDLDVTVWHDVHINAWKDWKLNFESHLNKTDAFLLLVSEDLINSQFIRKLEFRTVVDRYKEGKTVLISAIMDHCQWDNEYNLVDHLFNLNQCKVLPEGGKPLSDWDSPDQAYAEISSGVKKIISSAMDEADQEKGSIDPKGKDANDMKNDSEAVDLDEKHRLWQEAEIKRRAEVKNRILEAAKASAKRREEEEKRLIEEAIANRKAEEERRLMEAEKVERNEIEPDTPEDKAPTKQEDKKRKVYRQEEIRRKEKARDLLENQASAHREPKGTYRGKPRNLRRILLIASSVIVLLIIGIWAFSTTKNVSEEPTTNQQNLNAIEVEDTPELEENESVSQKKKESISKLSVGDRYEGGIIFEIDHNNKTGKIAHSQDAGPMTWVSAMKIDEQLGDGWRLPTLEELELMYRTVGPGATNSAQFANQLYWSATSYDEYQARLLRFPDGNSSYHYNKEVEHRQFLVRAIRDLKL